MAEPPHTLTHSRFVIFSTDIHLFKNKRLFIPHWVNGIGCGGPLGAIFLLGVSWQPNHLHLHARFHALVGQKLARKDLERQANEI